MEDKEIAEEAVLQRKEKGKAREARVSQKRAKAGEGRPSVEV